MLQQLKVLEEVIQKLNKSSIDYMLTGSLALSLYTEPRMTRDIDIVISIENLRSSHFAKLFQDKFYIDEEAVQLAIKHEKMFNMIHNETGVKRDFIIQKATEFEKVKFKNKQPLNLNDFTCLTIRKEDLIIQKLYWAKDSFSEMQLGDVRNLLKSGYDSNYINDWIKKLKLEKIWDEANK
ncbi:MAG TPA: hypothetical protein PLG41_21630 [Leptospiraceae bacterium]|nr:hypothetical protein [Leptospiraceae bacterium]